MTNDVYDLVVVGSGGAAMSAAITARQSDKTVLLIDAGTLGGTCVNVGCVPSKTLLHISAHRAAAADPYAGAPTSAGPVDMAALISQKDELVAHLRQDKYAAVADAYGFEVRRETPRSTRKARSPSMGTRSQRARSCWRPAPNPSARTCPACMTSAT